MANQPFGSKLPNNVVYPETVLVEYFGGPSYKEVMRKLREEFEAATGVPRDLLFGKDHIDDALHLTLPTILVTMDQKRDPAFMKKLCDAYGISGDIPEEENIMGETYTTCPVFEAVAVLFEEDKKPVIVLPPKLFVCEGGKEEARTLAIRAIPKEFEDNISKVKVYVRPFA